jgi:hypothetical protein
MSGCIPLKGKNGGCILEEKERILFRIFESKINLALAESSKVQES